MIIDGTGHDYSKIANDDKLAVRRRLGYDTYMVFVNNFI